MRRSAKDIRPKPFASLDADLASSVVECLRPYLSDERALRIDAIVERRISSVVLVLDRFHDPHNAGAVLRSAEAFGLVTIHAVEPVERFVVARKSSLGAHKWLDVHRHPDADSASQAIRSSGHVLHVADPGASSGAEALRRTARIALCFGNEHDGVSETLRAAAAGSFSLPIRGFVESFNVSVAVALALSATTAKRTGDLSYEERARLRAIYYCRSVRRAETILASKGIRLPRPRP